MSRISGMIWGLGLLVVISQWTSPASAWDHDDDDGYFKHHRRYYYAPIVRQPIVRQPVYGPQPLCRASLIIPGAMPFRSSSRFHSSRLRSSRLSRRCLPRRSRRIIPRIRLPQP